MCKQNKGLNLMDSVDDAVSKGLIYFRKESIAKQRTKIKAKLDLSRIHIPSKLKEEDLN